MIRYLNTSDYGITIQPNQLNQLLQIPYGTYAGINPKLITTENIAIAEVISYLVQRWDVSAEFTNTGTWSFGITYSANDRIILDYATFSTIVSYSFGDCTTYNSNVYFSATANSATTSTPDILTSDWTLIAPQYTIFYAQYPFPLFNSENYYNKGDIVFWKGHTYSAYTPTLILDTTQAIQYNRTNWLPEPNILPNSIANNGNESYWVDNGTYSIPSGTLPNDTRFWTQGDNRNQQILLIVMDIVMFHLHKTITPTNVPEMRKIAYQDAIKVLRSANKGDLTLDVQVLQPTRGLKTRFASNVRRNNNY